MARSKVVVAHERGQEHDGDREPLPDRLGRGDAIHFTRQLDIHQHQVGPQLVGQDEGFLSPWRLGHRLIAQERQLLGDVPGHDGFVFHNENSRLTHEAPSRGCGRLRRENDFKHRTGSASDLQSTLDLANQIGDELQSQRAQLPQVESPPAAPRRCRPLAGAPPDRR